MPGVYKPANRKFSIMAKSQSIIEMYMQQAQQGTPEPAEIATRDLQLFHSILGHLPNPDPILRKAGKQITVYEGLMYDDQVGQSIESLELAITSMPWEIDDNGAGDSWAKECRAMIDEWDNERIFSEAMNARLFGYQPLELIWEKGSRWRILDIIGKPPEWFFFNHENELRLRVHGNQAGRELNPLNFILVRNKPSYKNPYGVAALSRCFWPVAFKKGGLKFWLKFVEKYGMPFIVGKQPRTAGSEATDKLLDGLAAMVQDAVAVIPDDSSVDILEAAGKGSSGDLFERMVRYHDSSIAKAIVGQTLTSGQGEDGGGSYALGTVHQNTFENIVRGVAKQVKKVYDTALKHYTEVNRGGPAPVLRWIEGEDVQKDRADRDLTLSQTGHIRFTAKYYKDRYNLDDEEFEIVEPQPAQPFHGFSEEKKPVKFSEPEEALDELDQASSDSASRQQMYQRQMEAALGPVIEVIENATSFEEAMQEISKILPDMDVTELEERLSRAMFASEVWGRISAEQEEEAD